jgi:cytochrome c oxidase cbb3-type subunit 3
MTGLVFAQGGASAPQTPAPAGQPAAPAAGRGGEPQGRGQAPGARRGGFPQYTRQLPAQEVIIRGQALYDNNCASCHAPDLRGTAKGINILRSGDVFRDQEGEVIGPALGRHKPPLNVLQPDVVALAAYLHSVQATMGGQGSPPGRNPTNIELNVLVGNAQAGEAKFKQFCASCHSVTGDLANAGTKYGDARALQNAWVAGAGGRFGGGGRGGGGGGNPAVVTMANGTKLEGTLVRQDDFLIVLMLPDGTRRSMARTAGMKVDVRDPQAAHKKMVLDIDDPNNQNMYDITAYLATIK